MSSSIAHDFNNSLQSIFGNVELAMLNNDNPNTTQEYLKTIKNAARAAAERVQHIQRFGGTKQTAHAFASVDMNEIIHEVKDQTRPLWKDDAEQKGITFNVTLNGGNIPLIAGHKGELSSALFNIFKNGFEAMPEGGSLSVSTKKNTTGIVITIKDTGTGMNEETRLRLFQPFYSTKGFDIGRGLGMSGVHSIIKEHGGTIIVKDTAPGKGTTIEISLPFSDKVIIDDPSIKVETPDQAAKKSHLILKVLWVEDDAIIRMNAALIVEMIGHQIDTASGGEKALELLQQNKYDIVFTDIGMPVMNGWQLADIINEQYNGQMKLAVVSGWGLEIDMEKKNKHQIDYIINKPFAINEIEKLLEEIVLLKTA